ncbi:aldo/keto reductase [Pontibacter sp. CAU 1760]
MKYNALGNSGIKVSEVSFGCMSLGEDHEANKALLHQALDQGINLFDTADLYQQGENERTVGKAFRGMRDEVVLATKVGNEWRPDGSGWDWNPTKAYILKAVEESLKRLQTDYIDLYQLHGGTIEDPIHETIEAFEELRAAGKIRAYGISSIRPNVIREYVQHADLASVMMQYSLLDRRPEESCFTLLEQNKISVLARGSYAQGLLLGKAPKLYLGRSESEVAAAAQAVANVASQNGEIPAAVAARFVLRQLPVASAVLGIRTEAHLQDALQVANAQPLSHDSVTQLTTAVSPTVYEQHR